MSSYLHEQVEYEPLAEAAGRTRRNYQAGRYRQVLDELPDLLRGAHVAVNGSLGCDGQRVAADLYQITCSVLLKCGQGGLAMLAADRSTAAALRSGDPPSMGASARGLAHALADCGHPGRAVSTALAAAQQLKQDGGPSTAPAMAVFGALLLRAAILAAGAEDRVTAHGLLNEAQIAAERLDGDDNLYGAYFCAHNLRIHRVSVAVRLGDAGGPSSTLAMSTRPGSGWASGERRTSLTLRGRSPNGANTARRTVPCAQPSTPRRRRLLSAPPATT